MIWDTPNYLRPSLAGMIPEPIAVHFPKGFANEADAFLEALEVTPPDALTECAQWRAHEVAAHLGAGALEIALNLEAYVEGRPVPATRGFEEREAPFRAMADVELRSQLPRSIERVAAALEAVLTVEPDAVVPWSGRQMVVATFVTHLRSEFALHRFDLVGDDETGITLLAQPELTDHAVSVLGRALVARGARSVTNFAAAVAARDTRDVVVVVDGDGPRLERSDLSLEPAVVGDSAARLLLLWGRQPGDPRRCRGARDPSVSAGRILTRVLAHWWCERLIHAQASGSTPSSRASSLRPASLTRTTRRSPCVTQPSSTKRLNREDPRAPARWGRCSLQSRQ